MPILYPQDLPTAGLTGAGGGEITTVISDEKDLGAQELRERQGLRNQIITVEFPPITQEVYEVFIEFFETTLYGGILPFEFNDPITKDTHVYKFVKAFTETRVTPQLIKISFQLIRLRVSSPLFSDDITPAPIPFDYFLSGAITNGSSSSFAAKGNHEIADQDFTIEHLRFFPRNEAGTSGEIIVALVDGSEIITEILARKSYPSTVLNEWFEIQLDTPVNILSGQAFLIAMVRTDGTGTSSAGVSFVTSTIQHDSIVATFQNTWRRTDNDIQVGDGNGSTSILPWTIDYKGVLPA